MILVINNSGLGNKIKNLVSAMRKAYIRRDRLEIRFNYKHLFEIPLIFGEGRPEVEISSTWMLEVDDAYPFIDPQITPQGLVIVHDKEKNFFLEHIIDCQYENIAEFYKLEFLKFFKIINFRRELLDLVDASTEKYDLTNCIGVHIRSWIDEPTRRDVLFDENEIILKMREYPADKIFFLATDSVFVAEKINSIFRDRVITQKITYPVRHTSLADRVDVDYCALIDMLCLSRCKELIGSYQSSFSECVWWLSGCSQRVVIPISEKLRSIQSTH